MERQAQIWNSNRSPRIRRWPEGVCSVTPMPKLCLTHHNQHTGTGRLYFTHAPPVPSGQPAVWHPKPPLAQLWIHSEISNLRGSLSAAAPHCSGRLEVPLSDPIPPPGYRHLPSSRLTTSSAMGCSCSTGSTAQRSFLTSSWLRQRTEPETLRRCKERPVK